MPQKTSKNFFDADILSWNIWFVRIIFGPDEWFPNQVVFFSNSPYISEFPCNFVRFFFFSDLFFSGPKNPWCRHTLQGIRIHLPPWFSGKSSTQKCHGRGYVSSQEAIYIYMYIHIATWVIWQLTQQQRVLFICCSTFHDHPAPSTPRFLPPNHLASLVKVTAEDEDCWI